MPQLLARLACFFIYPAFRKPSVLLIATIVGLSCGVALLVAQRASLAHGLLCILLGAGLGHIFGNTNGQEWTPALGYDADDPNAADTESLPLGAQA